MAIYTGVYSLILKLDDGITRYENCGPISLLHKEVKTLNRVLSNGIYNYVKERLYTMKKMLVFGIQCKHGITYEKSNITYYAN